THWHLWHQIGSAAWTKFLLRSYVAGGSQCAVGPMPALIAIYVFITPCLAMAHGVEPHRDLSWTFDPWIVLPLASLGILYIAGTITLSNRRHSGFGRTLRGPTLFWGGVATLVVALVSPLHELGERL